jgi:signal recognition particle subunit SRP54
VGQEVLTALSPGEQVIKIVRDELVETLGKDTARMKFASQPPTVVLMAGLQGSGKTTTSGKLAHWFKKGGHRPLLVSVDVYRPAAREQLKVVAARPSRRSIYEGEVGEANTPDSNTASVERLVKEARREAIVSGCDVLIVDTAGRLHIDDHLMDEMQSLKKLLNPSGDAVRCRCHDRTGRGALRRRVPQEAFAHRRCAHQDGWRCPRRRGAFHPAGHRAAHQVHRRGRKVRCARALSSRPHRVAHSGHGRHSLADRSAPNRRSTRKKPGDGHQGLTGDGFSLEDFRDQLRQVKKMGSIKSLMG